MTPAFATALPATSTLLPPTVGIASSAIPSRTPSADACLPLTPAADRPAYRFAVTADPVGHRLQVRQRLALADPLRLATGDIVFNVPAAHATGVFTMTRVAVAGQSAPAQIELAGTTLRVALPQAARRAPAVTVCLDYDLALPPAGGEGISAVHTLGWSELGMVAGLWYPVLAPYDPGQGWRLIPYHPVGDPIIFEAADYDVAVSAPAGYTVIAAGPQGVKEAAWQFHLAEARGFAFVVSNRLQVIRGESAGIPFQVYHLPEHRPAALDAGRAVHEALALFTAAYGPYPYPALTIVEAVQFGGMEYSGLVTFSSQSFDEYQPPAAGAEFGADFLIKFVVHEIAHQWWYGAVGNDQANEPWLDEALARFSERLYYERLHGANLEWWGSTSVSMATVPINRPIYDFADTAAYVQAVYVSAARFLLAVRQMLGDQAFFAFLQDYYRQNRRRLVSQAEFLKVLRAQTGPALDELLPVYFDPVP